MKIKKNGKTINLTESDLQRIVKSRLNESTSVELGRRVSELEKKVSEIIAQLDRI